MLSLVKPFSYFIMVMYSRAFTFFYIFTYFLHLIKMETKSLEGTFWSVVQKT